MYLRKEKQLDHMRVIKTKQSKGRIFVAERKKALFNFKTDYSSYIETNITNVEIDIWDKGFTEGFEAGYNAAITLLEKKENYEK